MVLGVVEFGECRRGAPRQRCRHGAVQGAAVAGTVDVAMDTVYIVYHTLYISSTRRNRDKSLVFIFDCFTVLLSSTVCSVNGTACAFGSLSTAWAWPVQAVRRRERSSGCARAVV